MDSLIRVVSDTTAYWIKEWFVAKAEADYQVALQNYEEVRVITIEIACEIGQGSEAFCKLLNEVRRHREQYHQAAKIRLENAIEEVKNQIFLICHREQKNRWKKNYIKALCRNLNHSMAEQMDEPSTPLPPLHQGGE